MTLIHPDIHVICINHELKWCLTPIAILKGVVLVLLLYFWRKVGNVGNPIAGRDINIVVRHDQVLCYRVGIVVVVVLPIFE